MKTILFIEPDDQAFRSVLLMLNGIGYSDDSVIRCTSIDDLAGVNTENVEIVLIGFSLQDPNGINSVNRVKKSVPHTPMIALAGITEIETAIGMIRQGAQDYLVKGKFNGEMLAMAILFAMERYRIFDNILVEKQNLHAVINNTNDIIWSIDRDHHIVLANNAYWERIRKISGKERDDMTADDFDKDTVKTWAGFYDQALKGELDKIVWSEINNGQKIYEEISFHLIHDRDNNIVGVSCFSRDITKQYTHLEMIKKQNDQLEQIASINSHDVRGPVASILGLAQFFDLDNPGNPENMEILENLQKAANNLDNAVRRINDQTISLWYRSGDIANDLP